MSRIDRRKFLKRYGGGALAMKAGGMAGILASGHAPAIAQGTTLHWLRVNDFVPASDAFLRKELLPEAEKALGLKINLETINGNDVQARITAGIQTSAGPDMINAFNNWAQLYAESVADVSDVAEEIGKAQGGYYDLSVAQARNEKGWLSVPWCVLGILISYRKSWFEEVGYPKFPETWEQYRDAGKKLKAKGRPIGQTLGHTYGDAPAFSYPYLVVLGRQGGGEGRQDRRAQQQGDPRVGQVHAGISGKTPTTTAGSPGTTRTTIAHFFQAPFAPPATPRRFTSRAYARRSSIRPKKALLSRTTSYTRPILKGRPAKPHSISRSRTWSWAIPRTKKPRRISCAGLAPSPFTRSGLSRRRGSPSVQRGTGPSIRCGTRTR